MASCGTRYLPHLLKRVIAQGRAKSRASCVTRHGRGTRHGRVAIDWPPLGRNGALPSPMPRFSLLCSDMRPAEIEHRGLARPQAAVGNREAASQFDKGYAGVSGEVKAAFRAFPPPCARRSERLGHCGPCRTLSSDRLCACRAHLGWVVRPLDTPRL